MSEQQVYVIHTAYEKPTLQSQEPKPPVNVSLRIFPLFVVFMGLCVSPVILRLFVIVSCLFVVVLHLFVIVLCLFVVVMSLCECLWLF